VSDRRDVPVSRRAVLQSTAAFAGSVALSGAAEAQEGGDGTSQRPVFPEYVDDAAYGQYSDMRGSSEVTVQVGATSNQVAYAPTAIWVDPGTTINFEWVSNGHNVVPNNQPGGADWRGSGDTLEDEGFTDSHTFETEGMYTYYCQPHEQFGMKGAVAVGDDVETETVGGGESGRDGGGQRQPSFPAYVSGAAGGEYADVRGQSEVAVEVGTGSNQIAYAPTNIWVDPGTTVTFEWMSNGHNVVPNSQPDGADWRGSGDALEDEGYTYSHTFEAGGMYTYYCSPHEQLGMVGAIAVGDDVETVAGGVDGGDSDSEPALQYPFTALQTVVATIAVGVVTLLGAGGAWLRWNGDTADPAGDARGTTTVSAGTAGTGDGANSSRDDALAVGDERSDAAREAAADREFGRAVAAWEDALDAYETALDSADGSGRGDGGDRAEAVRERVENAEANLATVRDRRQGANRLERAIETAIDSRERAETALADEDHDAVREALDWAETNLDRAADLNADHDLGADTRIAAEREVVASLWDRCETLRERVTGGPPDVIPGVPRLSLSHEQFEAREPIGRGGNADVYRVTIPTPDGDVPVAVKEPRMDGTLHSDAVDRLLTEAETWAKLDDHDHVVGIVDYGADPMPWIAMEYMDGGHVGTRAGELPFEQALWTAFATTEAVRHAHRRGVAHLDLKPTNILFREVEDAWDVPKVGDWGLSKHLLDHSKSVEGISPHYAAPEQFEERYGAVDDITDVYQLGAVCYELFTGRPPFEGSPVNVMNKVLNEQPTPPSEVTDVPPALDEILLTAMAVDKDDRFESVIYLRDELRQLDPSLLG